MKNIKNSRVITSENVSTDHRMVVATIRKETRRNRIGRTFQRKSVNIKEVMKHDIKRKYQEEISHNVAQLPDETIDKLRNWKEKNNYTPCISNITAQRTVSVS